MSTEEIVCRFCNEPILFNSSTSRWEADTDWPAQCVREGELKEAYVHLPPAKPNQEDKPKPVPVSQPWIFPWTAPQRQT